MQQRILRPQSPVTYDGLSLSFADYPPMEHQGAHRHETANISMIYSGALEERSNGAVARAGVCSVVVKPAECLHEDTFGPTGARTFQLRLSPALSREYAPHLEYRWIAGGAIARQLTSLMFDCQHAAPDRECVWNAYFEVLSSLATETQRERVRAPQRKIRDLAASIEAGVENGISIRHAAAALGMHPVSLARAFRKQIGCSITEFIRRARILQSCRLVDEGEMNLAEIAMKTGFADQAHFTRAFRAEVGVPPGNFRRMIRVPVGP